MDDSVKTFLDKIQELKEKKIKVDSISIGKPIDCSPLSFKQQKDLISTVADGAVGALKFQKHINGIINDNTENNDLKISDKLPIILKLRSDAIGDTLKIGDGTISLKTILDKVKKLKYTQSKSITTDQFTIELELPSLRYESQVIQATIDAVKKEGDGELGKNIGNIYTYEIVKYIKKITFTEGSIEFSEIPVKDRVKIVDNLPISVNSKIIDFIQKNKMAETNWMTLDINGESKTIEIDVSFFDT